MKEKLTTYDIAYIMKKFRLKTVEDFADFGLNLKEIGRGCSRIAYSIRGYNLVVKIPFDGMGEDGTVLSTKTARKYLNSAKRHARQEYKAYRRIANKNTKKYKVLRPHLPEIYCITKDGVILMKKYRRTKIGWANKQLKYIRRHADFLFPENGGTDIYGENVGRDEDGTLIILDMGCFFSW